MVLGSCMKGNWPIIGKTMENKHILTITNITQKSCWTRTATWKTQEQKQLVSKLFWRSLNPPLRGTNRSLPAPGVRLARASEPPAFPWKGWRCQRLRAAGEELLDGSWELSIFQLILPIEPAERTRTSWALNIPIYIYHYIPIASYSLSMRVLRCFTCLIKPQESGPEPTHRGCFGFGLLRVWSTAVSRRSSQGIRRSFGCDVGPPVVRRSSGGLVESVEHQQSPRQLKLGPSGASSSHLLSGGSRGVVGSSSALLHSIRCRPKTLDGCLQVVQVLAAWQGRTDTGSNWVELGHLAGQPYPTGLGLTGHPMDSCARKPNSRVAVPDPWPISWGRYYTRPEA